MLVESVLRPVEQDQLTAVFSAVLRRPRGIRLVRSLRVGAVHERVACAVDDEHRPRVGTDRRERIDVLRIGRVASAEPHARDRKLLRNVVRIDRLRLSKPVLRRPSGLRVVRDAERGIKQDELLDGFRHLCRRQRADEAALRAAPQDDFYRLRSVFAGCRFQFPEVFLHMADHSFQVQDLGQDRHLPRVPVAGGQEPAAAEIKDVSRAAAGRRNLLRVRRRPRLIPRKAVTDDDRLKILFTDVFPLRHVLRPADREAVPFCFKFLVSDKHWLS